MEQYDARYTSIHVDNDVARRLQNIALPVGTNLINPNDPYASYQITGLYGREDVGIVYSARKYFVGSGNADLSSMDYAEVRIHELVCGSRGEDGVQMIRPGYCRDGQQDVVFYSIVSKKTQLSLEQVFHLFQNGGDPDFFESNGTAYFVQHENGNTRLRIGSVFTHEGTRYQAESVCGQGSFGRVWVMKRVHQSLMKSCTSQFSSDWTRNRVVAIKQFCYEPVHSLHSTFRQPERAFQDFRQGFLAHARLNYPNVAKAYAFFDIFDVPSCVMEYVEGCNLREYVDRNGCMSEQEAKTIVITICRTIKYCHEQGVHHGDLKPDNVMIASDGTIKLIDFGGEIHCSDVVGMARVYFYLLSGVFLSVRNLSSPIPEAMEQVVAILYERKVSDVAKSQILYMLEDYLLNDKTLDFVLCSMENNTPMPIKVQHNPFRALESTWEEGVIWCNPRSSKQRADIPSYQFYKFEQNGLFGMKNKLGDIVIPPIYSALTEIGNYHIPGPGPTSGWDIVGVKTYRLGLIGWYKIVGDNQMILEIELTDEQILERRMWT